MDFSCSKYVQFAHITISDEMQSITISNIFVLTQTFVKRMMFLCELRHLETKKNAKKIGNSTQMGNMQCPHHFY